MLSFTEINILGSLIDVTFGRQSSHAGSSAIRANLAGDKLVVKYIEIVNIAKDQDKIAQVTPVRDRAVKIVKEYVSNLEKNFANEADRRIKFKSPQETTELKAMSFNFLSPIRPTQFEYVAAYEIG